MARWYRENGQGKRYTENTAGFSPKEKQDALRQRGYAGVRIQGQIYSNPDGGGSEVHHDGIKCTSLITEMMTGMVMGMWAGFLLYRKISM